MYISILDQIYYSISRYDGARDHYKSKVFFPEMALLYEKETSFGIHSYQLNNGHRTEASVTFLLLLKYTNQTFSFSFFFTFSNIIFGLFVLQK